MHSKNFRTTICFMISIVLCSSIQAQIGCLCDDQIIYYQSLEDSEKYNYEFFYRKIKIVDTLVEDEKQGEYIYSGVTKLRYKNADSVIHRAKTYVGTSTDKSFSKFARWYNVECCDSQIKGYLVITEKSTKRQQIISFPILFMEHEYWFYCCEFKEGVFRVSRWSSYTRDTDLVPCENDLPQYILESCQNYSINKTKRTRKHSIQERQP